MADPLFRPEILQEIVRRVVLTARPKKIILFGSAARGEMGPHSDFDLLVVIDSKEHRRHTAMRIYRNLVGVGFATDLVVVTEDDLVRYQNRAGMVIGSALQNGKLLYAA